MRAYCQLAGLAIQAGLLRWPTKPKFHVTWMEHPVWAHCPGLSWLIMVDLAVKLIDWECLAVHVSCIKTVHGHLGFPRNPTRWRKRKKLGYIFNSLCTSDWSSWKEWVVWGEVFSKVQRVYCDSLVANMIRRKQQVLPRVQKWRFCGEGVGPCQCLFQKLCGASVAPSFLHGAANLSISHNFWPLFCNRFLKHMLNLDVRCDWGTTPCIAKVTSTCECMMRWTSWAWWCVGGCARTRSDVEKRSLWWCTQPPCNERPSWEWSWNFPLGQYGPEMRVHAENGFGRTWV